MQSHPDWFIKQWMKSQATAVPPRWQGVAWVFYPWRHPFPYNGLLNPLPALSLHLWKLPEHHCRIFSEVEANTHTSSTKGWYGTTKTRLWLGKVQAQLPLLNTSAQVRILIKVLIRIDWLEHTCIMCHPWIQLGRHPPFHFLCKQSSEICKCLV